MTETPLTDIALTMLDGRTTTLAELADGAAPVVNVASKCGLTPQYTALEQLAKGYGERGLTVIGVPCNQFMGQEPGTNEEIATFCSTTFGVDFPMTEKVDVKGATAHPMFRWMKGELGEPAEPLWNFHKFLIGKDGRALKAFNPRTEPTSPEIRQSIEAAL